MNEQILKRLTTRTLILFAALLCMPLSHAGTNLAPVILEINENARTTLTITNNSDRRVPYQLSLLSWTQANGEDVLAPSDSLVISPAAVSLAPGASREIRIGFRDANTKRTKETAYRVLIEELPDLQRGAAPAGTVQIVTKHLLPLYVAPSEKANAPTLSWTAQRIGNGLQIRAENKGGSRFPIRQLTVENNLGTKVPLTPAGRSVVLSGGSRQWLLTTGNQAALDGWSLVITDQSGQTTRHSLQPLLR